MKEAEKNPKKIIDLYTGSDMRLRILFVTALDKDVIKYRAGVYSYNNTNIGITEESCLIWLQQASHSDILKSIEMETYPEAYLKGEVKKEPVKTFAKNSEGKK